MNRTAASLLALLLLASCGRESGRPAPEVPAHELAVGQVWNYHTRDVDQGSTLTICKLEDLPKAGSVVHVSLAGLHLKNPRAPGGYTGEVPHAPFTRAAIERSITTLHGQGSPPQGFEAGYRAWQEARGGVFSMPVADVAGLIEKSLK
ncbi:MAG TPA: hypothetical protein VGS03_04525 [Candidatus Polarisedimenticolia bacterium]|jgi:hypothetical protein|nr:hypothetical protein [Candidatus Polarisedimenticolia bacterium]